MAEVLLFIQHGWQNIWRQKTIWFFSALPIIGQLVLPNYDRGEQNLVLLCFYLMISILMLVISVVSFIGVPYLAYCFSIGKSVTIRETLLAVRKFAGRIIGCSFLGSLLMLPCIFLVLAIAFKDADNPLPVSNTAILVFLPLSVFSCLWDFTIFGFFENDWGIRKSIEHAWSLFTSHFGALALLGLFIVVILRISSAITGAVTVLIQSGFDVTLLNNLNIIDPTTTLGENVLFGLINGIIQTIYSTFSTSVFVLAYLKYSGVKNPAISKSG